MLQVPTLTKEAGAARRAAAGLAVCAFLSWNAAGAQDSTTPDDAAAPAAAASPSQPPFWARPKPAAPANCEPLPATPAPVARSSQSSTGLVLGAGAAGVLMLLLYWRSRARAGVAPALRQALPVRATPSPIPPPRPAPARPAAARTPTATPTVPPPPAPSEWFSDLGATTQIELGESPDEEASSDVKGFYAEVAASLAQALEREPARQDLRRKLLEVYGTAGMAGAYVKLAHDYLDQNHGARDHHWRGIAEVGRRLAPEHELFQEPGRIKAIEVPQRRHYERKIDQGRLAIAQEDLSTRYQQLRVDAEFQKLLQQMLADGVRRPSPLTPAAELGHADDVGQILLKREDRRRHTDDALINALGQCLLAQRLGKTRVVTATHDGTHGQAVATVAARLRLECVIYIGMEDMYRHYARVLRMRQLGAHVRPVQTASSAKFTDARQYALDAWLEDPKHTLYVSGLSAGPPPYPMIVRDLLSLVGRESIDQVGQLIGDLPSAVVVGRIDGYLGLGLLQAYVDRPQVRLYWVDDLPTPEAPGVPESGDTAALASRACQREFRWLQETGRLTPVLGNVNDTLRVIERFHVAGTTLYTASARVLAYCQHLARQLEPKQCVLAMLPNQDAPELRGASQDW